MSQAQVAEEARISRLGYRNIEAGAVVPRVDSLMQIAAALGVRVEQLFVPVRNLNGVRFRAQKKMTTREQVLADVSRWLEDYCALEALLGERTPFAFGRVIKQLGSLGTGDQRPIEAAALARAAVGVGPNDLIRDVCGLLEDHGVKVITPRIASEGFFGLSVNDADGGPAVVVNVWERISVERWIFTAAHELAHLLLHLNAYDIARADEDKAEEREADTFAGHFLMPEHLFEKEWSETRGLALVERVLKVKRIFRVSYRSVLYRIAARSSSPKDVWIRFQVEHRKRAGRTLGGADEPERLLAGDFRGRPAARVADEPQRLVEADFMKDRLSRLVRLAVDQEAITLERAAEILRIDLEQMKDRARSWQVGGP
jgi:Zn-dependent peptidase ImmA (M78 family)/transcriptional regulator with XRE-family HTH domain